MEKPSCGDKDHFFKFWKESTESFFKSAVLDICQVAAQTCHNWHCMTTEHKLPCSLINQLLACNSLYSTISNKIYVQLAMYCIKINDTQSRVGMYAQVNVQQLNKIPMFCTRDPSFQDLAWYRSQLPEHKRVQNQLHQ